MIERTRPVPLSPSLRVWLVVTVVVGAGVFVALALAVWHVNGPVGLDGNYELALRDPWFMREAYLGSPQFVFFVASVVALVALIRRDVLTAAVCVLGPLIAGLCEIGAKHVVDRHLASSLSYPSGHAALSSALALALAVAAFRYLPWRGAAALTVVFFAVSAAVCGALVRLAWHFPTDVVGGVALGVALTAATALVLGPLIGKIGRTS